ncbi:MAG: hypothetical protein JXQ27_18960 [Acidobacteria bacterium]|nr:hypothetical protein [Acidobacteriota bacterium]
MNIIYKSRVLFVLLLPATILSAIGLARVNRVEPGDLAAKATHVSIVRCREAQAVRHESSLVFTHYRFETMETVDGKAAPASFQLSILGGTIGHTRVVLHDTPGFVPEQYYVVFLRPRKDGTGLLLTGSSQGVYPARQDPVSGQWQIEMTRKDLLQKAGLLSERDDGSWIGLNDFRRLLERKGGAQ